MEQMKRFLEERAAAGALRALLPVERRGPGVAVIGGVTYVDFSSNDYLGLSGHDWLMKAACAALSALGASSSASRLMSGSLALHRQLEVRLARFKGREAALVFNSGYQANLGVVPALVGRGDCVLADRLSHASLVDGATLSRARLLRFRHNDPSHLEEMLAARRDGFRNALVVTESVFSMDGDIAPLGRIAEVARRFGAMLMVDEAHATGVFGEKGRGLADEGADVVMGTFSKALGGFGAYVAGSRTLVDYLVNSARSFIYSTALPPAVVAAGIAALDVLEEEPPRGPVVLERAAHLREALVSQGWRVLGESQIVPVVAGANARAIDLSAALRERGLLVTAVRPPTVPDGESRLRFSVSYAHTDADISRAVEAMRELR